jgi:hypothetical protein
LQRLQRHPTTEQPEREWRDPGRSGLSQNPQGVSDAHPGFAPHLQGRNQVQALNKMMIVQQQWRLFRISFGANCSAISCFCSAIISSAKLQRVSALLAPLPTLSPRR